MPKACFRGVTLLNSKSMLLENKKIRLGLIGARIDGQAGVVLDVLSYFKNIKVVAFFDNTAELKGTYINGIPVVGCIDAATEESLSDIDMYHISIGDNKARLDLYRKLKKRKLDFLTIVHPTAVVSKTAKICEGCFIGAQSVVQNNSIISNVSIINTAAVIEHDNVVGEAAHVAPRACTAGRVKIGDMSFIGIGAVIIPNIVIGELSFIAAGAVITKDVSDQTMMMGYSAKVHKTNIYTEISEDL
jgi:sugar O-acyltransferase (sialic acid O-acetyltransferase NeuD family)